MLWLLDGALQLQSFMFTEGFAKTVIAPAAMGQPSFVASMVEWNARLIAGHPVALDAAFAAIQLVLGLGFLFGRTVKPAIVASILWALGVWFLGEGVGGVAGGHASALTGAPGAALLYAVLAMTAWPIRTSAPQDELGAAPPLSWTLRIWAVLWVGFAVLSALPANKPSGLTSQLTSNATSAPAWLASVDRAIASGVHAGGNTSVGLLVMLELAVGLLALSRGPMRLAALIAGIALSLAFWAVGQSFGQIFSGQATDPNTGPLVILLGLTALGSIRRPRSTIWSINATDDASESSLAA